MQNLKEKRGDSKNEEDSSDNGSEVAIKKPKRTKTSGSDSNTDYEKYNEESDSSSSEEELEKGFDVQTDWYISRSDIKKPTILKVLFIIKDMISGNYLKEPTKVEIYSKIRCYEDRNAEFTIELKEMPWTKLRGITKAMWRKHKRDKEENQLEQYKNFAKSSNRLWEIKLTEYLNF